MQEALIDDNVLGEAQLMNAVEGDRILAGDLAALFLSELPGHLAAIRFAAAISELQPRLIALTGGPA
jgi:hypothetical protein